MRHQHSADHLLLMAGPRLLWFALPIRSDPPTAILTCSWGIFIVESPLYTVALEDRTFGKWHKLHILIWDSEEERPETGITALVLRGLYNSMDCWTVITSREEFHRVARVDDLRKASPSLRRSRTVPSEESTYKSIIHVSDPSPLPIWRHNLKSRDWLRPKNSD